MIWPCNWGPKSRPTIRPLPRCHDPPRRPPSHATKNDPSPKPRAADWSQLASTLGLEPAAEAPAAAPAPPPRHREPAPTPQPRAAEPPHALRVKSDPAARTGPGVKNDPGAKNERGARK